MAGALTADDSAGDPPASARADLGVALLLAVLVAAARLPWPPSSPHEWDSAAYLAQLELLVDHGELGAAPFEMDHPLYVLALGLTAAVGRAAAGLIELERAAWWTSIWTGALGAAALFLALRGTLDRWSALAGAIAWAAFPMQWWYAQAQLSDGPSAGALAGCLLALVWWLRRPGVARFLVVLLAHGAVVLIRPANLFTWAALGALAVIDAVRRRRARFLALLPLVALPPLALLVGRLAVLPDFTPAFAFSDSGQNDFRLARLLDGERLARYGGDLLRGVTLAPLLLAAAAPFLVLRRARPGEARLLLVAMLWIVCYVPVAGSKKGMDLRFLVPLGIPIAALAALSLNRLFAGFAPRVRALGLLAAAAGIGALGWQQARPVLVLMRDRLHYQKALAWWYRDHAPADALLLTAAEDCMLGTLLPGRRRLFVNGPEEQAQALPGIEEALAAGQRVFLQRIDGCLDWLARELERRGWRLVVAGRLPADLIRNQIDIGAGWMRADLLYDVKDGEIVEVRRP